MIMRNSGQLASAACRIVTKKAPTMEPVREPMPPKTTMMRKKNDCMNVNDVGFR